MNEKGKHPKYQVAQFKLKGVGKSELKSGNTDTFQRIDFPRAFKEGSDVVVIPMVQTFVGCNTPGIRIARVDHKGFKIRFNEIVCNQKGEGEQTGSPKALSDGGHYEETVGYVAFASD
jgi:hypothetical protein